MRIKKLDNYPLMAPLPEYAHPEDSGMDIRAAEPAYIDAGRRAVVRCGFSLEIPPGMEIQIRPRSGLARYYGVTVLNSPATIDSGYRGEIAVILVNHGDAPFQVNIGDRIAQMVATQVTKISLVETRDLARSDRDKAGFGSSGVD